MNLDGYPVQVLVAVAKACRPNSPKPERAWMRKAIEESKKSKLVIIVYPIDKWVLMMLSAMDTKVRNLGDVRWLATEDRSRGKGTGRHIACFILEPSK